MKYNQLKSTTLNESMINVPAALKDKISNIVGSVLLTVLNSYKEKRADERYSQSADRAMGIVQQKFSSPAMLNDASFKKIFNNSIDVDFDREQFIEELKTMKLDRDLSKLSSVYEEIQNLNLVLRVYDVRNNNTHGYVQPVRDNGMIIAIGINPEMPDPEHNVMTVLSTVNHECQHVVQLTVIKKLEGEHGTHSNKNPQLANQNAEDEFKDYVSSMIEFGPHISDFIGVFSRTCELLKMKGVLKKTTDQSREQNSKMLHQLIRTSLGADRSMKTFFETLKERDEGMFRKAWSTVVKNIIPVYKAVCDSDVKYSYVDIPSKDITENLNVMHTVFETLRAAPDIKLKSYKGDSLVNMSSLSFHVKDVLCTVQDHKNGTFSVYLQYKGNNENVELDAQALLAWIDEFELLDQPGEVFHSLQATEYSTSNDISEDVLYGMAGSVKDTIDDIGTLQRTRGGFTVTIKEVSFNVSISDDSKYIRIESPQYSYVRYNVTMMQMYSFFLHFNESYKDDVQKTLQILKVSGSYMDAMFRFDGVIKD